MEMVKVYGFVAGLVYNCNQKECNQHVTIVNKSVFTFVSRK